MVIRRKKYSLLKEVTLAVMIAVIYVAIVAGATLIEVAIHH